MPTIPNRYLVLDNGSGLATLTITRKNGQQFVVTFSAIDLETVQRYHWHVRPSNGRYRDGSQYYYVCRNIPFGPRSQRKITLAQTILGLDPRETDLVAHYRNGDGLDCRRSNIVATTPREVAQEYANPGATGERYIEQIAPTRFRVKTPRPAANAPQGWVGHFKTLAEAIDARDAWLAANQWH